MLVAITGSACGSESSDTSAQTTPTVDNNGSEPRVNFTLTAPARAQLSVMTNSTKTVLVSGDSNESTISTAIAIDARLAENAENFRLEIYPELTGFVPNELRPANVELASQRNGYNANGQRLDFSSEENIADVLAQGAFGLPSLTLSHPPTPLGVGAS